MSPSRDPYLIEILRQQHYYFLFSSVLFIQSIPCLIGVIIIIIFREARESSGTMFWEDEDMQVLKIPIFNSLRPQHYFPSHECCHKGERTLLSQSKLQERAIFWSQHEYPHQGAIDLVKESSIFWCKHIGPAAKSKQQVRCSKMVQSRRYGIIQSFICNICRRS